jgi:hypothetical protein
VTSPRNASSVGIATTAASSRLHRSLSAFAVHRRSIGAALGPTVRTIVGSTLEWRFSP